MKISKITIGRLYNLGNYEHVRYDLTVEIPEGESAAEAVIGMEKILAGLAPLKNAGLRSEAEIARMAREVEEMKTLPAVEWKRHYGHCEGTPEEIVARYEQSLKEATEARQKAMTKAGMARRLFDSLGGAAQWKDAKVDWQDDFGDE